MLVFPSYQVSQFYHPRFEQVVNPTHQSEFHTSDPDWCSAGGLVVWSSGFPAGGPALERVALALVARWMSVCASGPDQPKEDLGFTQHPPTKAHRCHPITLMVLTKINAIDSSWGQSSTE